MDIWIVCVDSKHGVDFNAFTEEAAAQAYIKGIVDESVQKAIKSGFVKEDEIPPYGADEGWRDAMELVDCETYIYLESRELPVVPSSVLRDGIAEIHNLLHQISQMRGMFGDEDGTIAEAVDSAEEFCEQHKNTDAAQPFSKALSLLIENFSAWDDEEASVKEEHAELIERTKAFLNQEGWA